MPIRNPFSRARSGVVTNDENARPDHYATLRPSTDLQRGVSAVSTTSVISIQSRKSQDTGDYKMSVVNDSGVFLPPSPTTEQGVWPRKYISTRTSTETWNSSLGEIEPFSISRESFDSYRRSFDITAKSPVVSLEANTRQSLDLARFHRIPHSTIALEPATDEEDFEDVGLEESRPTPVFATRRRGFFSKFSDSQDPSAKPSVTSPISTPSASVTRFLIPGRKRAQSQSKDGAELGTIQRPSTAIQLDEESHER